MANTIERRQRRYERMFDTRSERGTRFETGRRGAASAGTPNLAEDKFDVAPARAAQPQAAALDPNAMQELFGHVVDTAGLETLSGRALVDELRRRFYAKHVTLDYSTARRFMFTEVDNAGGDVRDVYTGRVIHDVTQIPRADGGESFNTEHTWPQSQLKRAGKGAAVSDLHHLFPVDTFANGKRGSFPFGQVQQVEWEKNGSKLGRDADGDVVFTPPPGHRGDVARAMFWISTAYGLPIDNEEEAVLREWANEDPVDAREQERNSRIADVQGDLNPFVVAPQLIEQVADF